MDEQIKNEITKLVIDMKNESAFEYDLDDLSTGPVDIFDIEANPNSEAELALNRARGASDIDAIDMALAGDLLGVHAYKTLRFFNIK